MASRAKVQEYLIASDLEANFRMLTQGTMAQLALDELLRGQKDAAFVAKVQEQLFDRVNGRIIEHGAKVMGELFTDDDLDQLIAFNKLPISQKFRDTMPEMQQAMLLFMSEGNLVTEDLIGEIIKELEEAEEAER